MELSSEIAIKKPKRLTSVVWNHFERVKKGDSCYAVCVHCNKKLSGSSNSGTTHLRNHLMRCLKRSNVDVTQLLAAKRRKKDSCAGILNVNFVDEGRRVEGMNSPAIVRFDQDGKDMSYKFANIKLDEERSRLDLAYMIIMHKYPLSMTEHLGFGTFVRNLQPLFQPVPSGDIELLCTEIYLKEKQKVYEMMQRLQGRISIAVDMWTYPETAGYLCLTAHYIDNDWKLGKKILNFVTLDSSYTDDLLSEIIIKCLMEWNLESNLSAVTYHDIFVSDDNVIKIKDWLSQSKPLLGDGLLYDVRCVAHVLNLIVEDAVEALRDVLEKIRASIKHVKSSQTAQGKFSEICLQAGIQSQNALLLDCPNQLHSTYQMLKTAVEHKAAFSVLHLHDNAFTTVLSDLEWEWASAISEFMKLIFEVSCVFSGNACPTANLYCPEICDVHLQLTEWCKSKDVFLSSVGSKMRARLDKYWSKCGLVLAISAVLDPRFKMKLVEYYYPQMYAGESSNRINDVSSSLRNLFNGYSVSPSWSSVDQSSVLPISSVPSSSNDARDRLRGFDKFVNETVQSNMPFAVVDNRRDRLKGFDKFLHETSQTQSTISDLDKYLEEPVFPRSFDFNILNWWKVHTARYPILSVVARDVLAIPMSTVAPQLVFSSGGKVLDHSRAALSPDTRQALICSHDWLCPEPEASLPSSIHSALAGFVERS
uniref:BED-type domain-containing protein n=1 Tax=Kalanchoe fedtschenkoi TaxID=63787 RepID=A0A7N0VBJ8_KALFE